MRVRSIRRGRHQGIIHCIVRRRREVVHLEFASSSSSSSYFVMLLTDRHTYGWPAPTILQTTVFFLCYETTDTLTTRPIPRPGNQREDQVLPVPPGCKCRGFEGSKKRVWRLGVCGRAWAKGESRGDGSSRLPLGQCGYIEQSRPRRGDERAEAKRRRTSREPMVRRRAVSRQVNIKT